MSNDKDSIDPLVSSLREKLANAEAAASVRSELESLAKQRADKALVVDRLTQQLQEAEQELSDLVIEQGQADV